MILPNYNLSSGLEQSEALRALFRFPRCPGQKLQLSRPRISTKSKQKRHVPNQSSDFHQVATAGGVFIYCPIKD